ncbi:dTDP-glucose 4,6-dehydratase [Infirmifilum sp.]|jgi:UDP-glucose 4-epimerase|uniref:dTDP-glucose 4,6-dehydratase n=1 Tax=Infirmifilum sp. TaxID=2856575 RepID=UPI003D0EB1BC
MHLQLLSGKEIEELRLSSILVTGGAGFIGSNLVEDLIKLGVTRIFVIDNLILEKIGGVQRGLQSLTRFKDKFTMIIGDVTNYGFMKEFFKREEIDIVFNLAILPLPLALRRPKFVFDQNVKIASTLAELQRRDLFRTLVHFSSSEAYGSAVRVPMSEEHPLQPSTSYGASKAAQDLLLLSYHKNFGTDVRIIRPFNNIGPSQNDFAYSAVVPRTIRRILSGKKPVIYGDGLQTRDFIYVKDTCEAAMKIAMSESLKGQVLNIASGRETTIRDLIHTICRLMGYTGEILYRPPRPGDVRRHFADITKARKLLGFEPKTSLEEALRIIIYWYKSIYYSERQ